MNRRTAVWAGAAVTVAVLAVAATRALHAGSRTIAASWQINNVEPWTDPPPTRPSLRVEVVSDAGSDHFIDTAITTAATGDLVIEHEVESADFFNGTETQTLTNYLDAYPSGTAFMITSVFKGVAGEVIDTEVATFVKP